MQVAAVQVVAVQVYAVQVAVVQVAAVQVYVVQVAAVQVYAVQVEGEVSSFCVEQVVPVRLEQHTFDIVEQLSLDLQH
ncbi:MAG: hypothetical protein H6Q73_2428 [Firmicutes bacterium]|nr:hypothetical protein [Bacillota bacterium]